MRPDLYDRVVARYKRARSRSFDAFSGHLDYLIFLRSNNPRQFDWTRVLGIRHVTATLSALIRVEANFWSPPAFEIAMSALYATISRRDTLQLSERFSCCRNRTPGTL